MKKKAIVFGAGQNFVYMKDLITNFYDIVALVDSSTDKQGKTAEGFLVRPPDEATLASPDDIIITPTDNREIIETLIKKGINSSRIIRLEELFDKVFKDVKLNIAVSFYGGMGDFLIGKNWLHYMAEKYDFRNVIVDVYVETSSHSLGKEIFENDELVNDVKSIDFDYLTLMKLDYDVVFQFCIVPYVRSFYGEKLAALNKALLNYILRLQKFGFDHYRIAFCHNPRFYKSIREIMETTPGHKYHNYCDVFDDLGIGDRYLFQLPVNKDAGEVLKKAGLEGKQFITINTGQHSNFVGKSNTRLWSYANWSKLARIIKSNYPHYVIVQIGENADAPDTFADIHLNGKTDLEDLKILLKEAALHFDYEGGLVHIRHILGGGSSVVLFGPTSVLHYSYDENIAVYTNECDACEWTTGEWLFECPKGMKDPICMYSITPELVYEKAAPYLEKYSE